MKREQLYRLNNIGVAFMEQYKHEDAVKQFKQALESDPNFAVARINLALAHFYLNDSRAAVEAARAGVKLAPDSPHAHYALAVALRNEKLYDESLAEFNKVLSIDPRDSATNIQTGQLHAQKQQYPQAIAAFTRAIESEPYNATAVYSLAQALIRSGQVAEGRKTLDRFQQLQASGYKTTFGNLYGEKGRYAEAVVSAGAEPNLVSKEAPNVRFVEADAGISVKTSVKPLGSALGRRINKAEFNDQLKRELVAPFSSSVSLADFDGDGRLDLFVSGVDDAGKPFVKLLRGHLENGGGKFSDVTEKSSLAVSNPASGAVFGDFDNDGKTDLIIFGYQTLALWRNNGDGNFTSILMNNQLEEALYFDATKLLAVDHPAEVEIYPNERLMSAPPYPEFKIYATRDARPPVKAFDDKGADILPLIKDVDRRYPEDFEKLKFKGYAKERAITLDLGDIRRRDREGEIWRRDRKGAGNNNRVLLLMTAWIDYADSTSNMAATQAGVTLTPPYLQVKNARGEWQTVIPQMGFPAGLPKTMTVDLTGKFLCDDSQIRIVTNMRIYWDQILVDVSSGNFPTRVTKLDPLRADLRWRGFPREYSPDGRKPLVYDYSVIEPSAPWKAHLGNYTRFGDVRELLLAPDDIYVITRNGDEMQIDFDARRLPALPAGWKRTFLVYADGFGKDMDINSARPETIGELPFHGMKSYPYSPTDRYPMTKRHQEYLRRYNTRTVNEQTQAFWQGIR